MALPGQLSKYEPRFCEMLIKHMGKGLSFDSFAAVARVHRDTLYEWAKVQPDFSDAKEQAYADNLMFWEQQGIQGLYTDPNGPKLNSTVWVFNMKNRHKWMDKQPEEVKKETIDLSSLPMKELMALAQKLVPELTEKKAELVDDIEYS